MCLFRLGAHRVLRTLDVDDSERYLDRGDMDVSVVVRMANPWRWRLCPDMSSPSNTDISTYVL
jgi:hypothetical protein